MPGYTAFFATLLASDIWRETKETRLLWVTLLAMATRHGLAVASLPALAEFARLTVDETRASLLALEGQHIHAVDGGWLLLNHAQSRAVLQTDERREYKRMKQAQYRAGVPPPTPAPPEAPVGVPLEPVVAPPPVVPSVVPLVPLEVPEPPFDPPLEPPFEPPFELTDETDEADPDILTEAAARDVALMMERFDRFWTAYPRHTAKSLALKSFRRLTVSDTLLDIILAALAVQVRSLQWTKDSGSYIPHPSTWLNQARWNDELEQVPPPPPPLTPHHIRKLGPAPLEQTWYEDCAALHGGVCQTGPAHRLRCQIDAVKGQTP